MAPGAAAGYAPALCASPMRKHCAPGSSSRIYLQGGAASGRPFLNGGAAASGRRPPVEESLVDILEEDPGAHGFRIGLAHRAVGRLLVVCWSFLSVNRS